MANNLPKTSDRFDAEGDWMAREFFSQDDLGMSPEEYAARHAHLLGCFSFDRYHYRDEELARWVKRVAEILSSPVDLEQCRQKYLSTEELATARQRDAEDF